MATIKLAPAPVFQINRYGEVVGNDHHGPRHIIECKSRIIEARAEVVAETRLIDIVNAIAHIENVENVYVLAISTALNGIKVRYGVHPDF
ncbi:hypothetical protein OFDDKENP_00181 [Aeromonas phage B614]|uniref:Uncharacterized protein n=1 Tax=Aeromonas phage vB_AehM_DM2 TaxID=2973716 RepID=A0AA94YS44_9CAUD|nr:hypothetical protein OFDDKENP_00181 [Aeromonas phage B614]UYD58342.1 hypothetical protein JNEOFJEA_00263 [Aeromonas phage UP87]UYD58456.1 hypothetical protein IPAKJDPM_00113 [Aeromonas phage avDM14-QBC]UYD58672.1 hypothetical protein HNNIDBEH_00079 [Aeromonas phage avDM10-HWA]UYD59025.1 hypothetical protein OFOPOMKI_00175 [Aeromonas phage avDM7-IJDJ]UYD59548.1 hypothetical protein JNMOADIG_00019 [Aeromonas phage avDM5]UYD59837.1 hypothetical protein LEHPIFIF_00064 [Aeromonas phage avDM9-HA